MTMDMADMAEYIGKEAEFRKTCETLRDNGGMCSEVNCDYCPGNYSEEPCGVNGWASPKTGVTQPDFTTVKAATRGLECHEGARDTIVIGVDEARPGFDRSHVVVLSAKEWQEAHTDAPANTLEGMGWNIANTKEECFRQAWHDSQAIIERQLEELDVLQKKVKASTEAFNILRASLEEA